MKKRLLTFGITLFTGCAMVAAMVGGLAGAPAAHADNVYQTLPFSQDWNSTNLISTDDDWSGVPGILGYDGRDDTTDLTGTDPQLYTADLSGTNIVVAANRTSPNSLDDKAVAEFHEQDGATGNPVVAIRAQTLYDRPHLLIHLNTTGRENIHVSYLLRDITSGWNAITPVALQYRVGGTGSYTNVPDAFVADATAEGATLTTPVSVTLPSAVNNQAMVQLRIMTTNAAGSDEWVGIDDISVTGDPIGGVTETPPTATDEGPTATPSETATDGPTPTATATATDVPEGEHKLYLPLVQSND